MSGDARGILLLLDEVLSARGYKVTDLGTTDPDTGRERPRRAYESPRGTRWHVQPWEEKGDGWWKVSMYLPEPSPTQRDLRLTRSAGEDETADLLAVMLGMAEDHATRPPRWFA